MSRHPYRVLHSVRWQSLRWGLVFPTLVLTLWACGAHDLQVPKPNPQQQTDFSILVSPERMVDILFMIDNSPSMDPKQAALADNFPKMIEALEQLKDGLPDIRIGVVSSNVGAGGGEAGGNCSIPLGNRAILWGNDPSVEPGKDNVFATVKNLENVAGAKGCGMNAGARWIEDVRLEDGVTRSRNYQGKLTDVFSCLAKAVGVEGCGFEHQLQAVRVALNPQDVNLAQNQGFLRKNAFLAVVLITDEDDCSATPLTDTNDGMFKIEETYKVETTGLRCAARGHVCNGKDIPDYDPFKGYTGKGPFEANFSDCEAKDIERQPPSDPAGIDPTYEKLPLIRIQEMVDHVNQLKIRPSEQILVSGIIGWPQEDKLADTKYRIDKDPTSGDQKDLWDYMPICSLPDQKDSNGNIYKAYGGFRLKKFIDSFEQRSVFSLCSPSTFKEALTQIGDVIASKMTAGCVPYPLIDTDTSVDEVQPQCQVMDRLACNTPGSGDCLPTGYEERSLPECINPENGHPLNPQNPEKAKVGNDARPCWYLEYDSHPTTGCPKAFKNQRISALRKNDGFAPGGTLLGMQCLTCASPPNGDESTCPAVGAM